MCLCSASRDYRTIINGRPAAARMVASQFSSSAPMLRETLSSSRWPIRQGWRGTRSPIELACDATFTHPQTERGCGSTCHSGHDSQAPNDGLREEGHVRQVLAQADAAQQGAYQEGVR